MFTVVHKQTRMKILRLFLFVSLEYHICLMGQSSLKVNHIALKVNHIVIHLLIFEGVNRRWHHRRWHHRS